MEEYETAKTPSFWGYAGRAFASFFSTFLAVSVLCVVAILLFKAFVEVNPSKDLKDMVGDIVLCVGVFGTLFGFLGAEAAYNTWFRPDLFKDFLARGLIPKQELNHKFVPAPMFGLFNKRKFAKDVIWVKPFTVSDTLTLSSMARSHVILKNERGDPFMCDAGYFKCEMLPKFVEGKLTAEFKFRVVGENLFTELA